MKKSERMSWNKIEEHLFEKYYVEGEDKELCKLMEEHDKEIRDKAIEEFSSLLANKDNIARYDIDEILSESGNFDYACDCFRKYIDKIAEQMKEVGE